MKHFPKKSKTFGIVLIPVSREYQEIGNDSAAIPVMIYNLKVRFDA